MSLSQAVDSVRRTVALVAVVGMISTGMPAQTAAPAPAAQGQAGYTTPLTDTTRPFSILGVWKPYSPHSLPQPVLRNTDRLHGLIQNGKMLLSLNDAVALVLENNFDIAIARYNLDIANTDILLAKSGGTVRGVSTGLLSGTPGGTTTSESTSGTSGSGTGGTSGGTSGAGSGSGGIVSSTQNSVGSAIDSYDPTLTAGISGDRATAVPQLSASSSYYPIYYGTITRIQQNTNQYNFQYSQGWATGTLATISFDNKRTSNNIPLTLGAASFYNPELDGSWKIQLRQHLLQGFGLSNNRREIVIAQNNRKVADASFRWQVITTVAQINNIYWDLVNAYENLKVKQTALEFADRTLSDNQKQVNIGTLAPIEVVSARSSVATAQQNLIVAQTQLQYQQLITKNAIAKNFNDPELTAAEIVPTDAMELSNEPLPPVEDLVSYALAHRPDIEESELNLRNNEINNKAAKNALLPTMDVVGYYQGAGQGGRTSTTNTGYGDVFQQMVDRNIPDKGVYVNLTIPLRNRAAQASQIRSQLEYRQNQLNFQQQKNTINLQVRNAAFALQQAKAGVEAARAARDYAAESLDAEQKKFNLGASTSYLVLQQQSNMTQKASDYIAALSTYEKNRVALEQMTATILDRNGILVEDAARGEVSHMPNVPGLVPNQTTQPAAAPAK